MEDIGAWDNLWGRILVGAQQGFLKDGRPRLYSLTQSHNNAFSNADHESKPFREKKKHKVAYET